MPEFSEQDVERLAALADAADGGERSAVLIGTLPPPARLAAQFPDLKVVEAPLALDSLAGASRYALAMVSGCGLADLPGKTASALLAALRDRYARRTVVVGDSSPGQPAVLTDNDLLALGFEGLPLDSGMAWLFDPDSESRRREWNNPDHWAHPERFDKRRW